MKAILIDDQQHVKIVSLSPMDTTADYFVPCGSCGDAVLHEYTTNCICHRCSLTDMDGILAKGWTWDHPGYFRKNFGDRITVIAGNSEYRFDFTFCSANFDLGYGPDMCIEVADWRESQQELLERGCFGPEELEELEMVYEFLYADMKRDESFGDWDLESGGLSCPNGCRIDNTAFETEAFHITKEMIWGVNCGELNDEQHELFAELQNMLLTWLDNSIA